MNNSICAVISFYNDLEGIKRLHAKLKQHKIHSIWADGRFHDFKQINQLDNSTDGSSEYLKEQKDVFVYEYGLCYEYDKLSFLINLAGDTGYDYVIMFGCDEYPEGDFKELIKNLDKLYDGKPAVYRVHFKIHENDATNKPLSKNNQVERIFIHPNRIKIKNTHWSFFIDNSDKPNRSSEESVKGITIVHDQSIRDKDRDDMMNQYQEKQRLDERENYYIHSQGLESTPTLEGLHKLFPNCRGIDKGRYFIIQGKIDATKLPLKWTRFRTLEGLCVMK